jgi:NAD-dependent SIR2 family protein deacetylase
MQLLSRLTEDFVSLEVMESHSEILAVPNARVYEHDVTDMNRAYDALLDSTLELFHDTQERRRAYNAAIRIARHQQRLATQRERARQARANTNPIELLAQAAELQEVVHVAVQNVPTIPRVAKPKSKALKKSELNVLVPDDCGICLEKSTRIQSVDTCCGHTFCKTCFDSYRASVLAKPTRTERVIKCPLCRKVNPKMTEFRERKAPTKKTPVEVTQTDIDELADILTEMAM